MTHVHALTQNFKMPLTHLIVSKKRELILKFIFAVMAFVVPYSVQVNIAFQAECMSTMLAVAAITARTVKNHSIQILMYSKPGAVMTLTQGLIMKLYSGSKNTAAHVATTPQTFWRGKEGRIRTL